jgi:hypothetical protein
MKISFKILTLFLLLSALLVPASPAYAQGPNPGGGQVLFGTNYTVESGETFQGDLVVFGGNVTLEEDATLNGNLVVIGGTIKSNGETKGDVVVVGGQVSLEETALVTGDVVTVGGQLQQAQGATIEGDVINNVAPDIALPPGRLPPVTEPGIPNVPDIPSPNINVSYNPFSEVFWIFFWAVVVSAFAMLLSLFWQPQIGRTGNIIVSQPLMTGAIGLLAFFVGAILFLTVIPPIVVAFAWLFGVVAMGGEVGERFSKAVNQVWSPVLTIGFGTFLLMLVGGAIGLIPCLGGLVLFLLGLAGIGGSVITWFGLRTPQIPALNLYTPPSPPPDSGPVPPAP